MERRARDDERMTEMLRTVAHPLRLDILALLCGGDETVGGMAARLGKAPAAVSQALSILRSVRLVAVTRRSQLATYRLGNPGLRELVPCIERTFSPERGPGRAPARRERAAGASRTPARPRR